MKLVFFGTSEYAVDILRALKESGCPIDLVVTQPSTRSGRGQRVTPTAIKNASEELELECEQPEDINSPEAVEMLKARGADVFVTAAYGQKLSNEVLAIPKFALNLHGSLLPKYRGAAPVQHAILAGDDVTGVTLMGMTDRMDAGPIFAKKEVPIEGDDTGGSVMEKLSKAASELLQESLEGILAGTIKGVEQNEDEATLAPKLEKEHGKVPWDKSAAEIDRHVRAMTPWPSAYTFCPTDRSPVRVQVVKGETLDLPSPGMPGTVVAFTTGIEVATTKGVYRILEVKRSGKRALSAVEFTRGFPLLVGGRLS